mmetsp:Transcript_30430/g.99353  ORF Transcript_30430/g.99353 Transcript_30430/m.99353 type:complete len:368 (-) Transcript_30430:145-1248(-)
MVPSSTQVTRTQSWPRSTTQALPHPAATAAHWEWCSTPTDAKPRSAVSTSSMAATWCLVNVSRITSTAAMDFAATSAAPTPISSSACAHTAPSPSRSRRASARSGCWRAIRFAASRRADMAAALSPPSPPSPAPALPPPTALPSPSAEPAAAGAPPTTGGAAAAAEGAAPASAAEAAAGAEVVVRAAAEAAAGASLPQNRASAHLRGQCRRYRGAPGGAAPAAAAGAAGGGAVGCASCVRAACQAGSTLSTRAGGNRRASHPHSRVRTAPSAPTTDATSTPEPLSSTDSMCRVPLSVLEAAASFEAEAMATSLRASISPASAFASRMNAATCSSAFRRSVSRNAGSPPTPGTGIGSGSWIEGRGGDS